MRLVVASLLTFAAGLGLTALVRLISTRFNLLKAPRDDRWNLKPTPVFGGVAIYLAFAAVFLLFQQHLPPGARLILFGGTLLFLTGLVDDLISIKPPVKLVIQLIVSATVVYFGRRLQWTGSDAFNIVITICWLVGMTNAINLLDNMDGLAAGIVAIACAFMTATFLLNGQIQEALLPAVLAGAALGFLVFNFNPASIFMGDCGSMFLGFTLGGMALLSSNDRTRNLTSVLITPVLIMLIPIFDTTLVAISRKLSGRPLSQGGRDHTSHRLVALGISERRAVLLLYILSAAAGVLALLVRDTRIEFVVALVAVFTMILFFIGLYLSKVRVYEDGDEALLNNTVLRAMVGFSYKRRFFEIGLDVVLIALAYHVAYLLRFEGGIPELQMGIFLQTLPLVIAIQMACQLLGNVYGGLWRYASVSDLLTIGKSVIAGAFVSALVIFGMYNWTGPSRAVFIIDVLLLISFLGASRLSFRLLRSIIVGKSETSPDARPVLIYGAGDGGELLLREIRNNPEHHYAPLGFIDDDETKVGKVIHGYRIYSVRELGRLVEDHDVVAILISTEKVPETKLEHVKQLGVVLARLRISIE